MMMMKLLFVFQWIVIVRLMTVHQSLCNRNVLSYWTRSAGNHVPTKWQSGKRISCRVAVVVVTTTTFYRKNVPKANKAWQTNKAVGRSVSGQEARAQRVKCKVCFDCAQGRRFTVTVRSVTAVAQNIRLRHCRRVGTQQSSHLIVSIAAAQINVNERRRNIVSRYARWSGRHAPLRLPSLSKHVLQSLHNNTAVTLDLVVSWLKAFLKGVSEGCHPSSNRQF